MFPFYSVTFISSSFFRDGITIMQDVFDAKCKLLFFLYCLEHFCQFHSVTFIANSIYVIYINEIFNFKFDNLTKSSFTALTFSVAAKQSYEPFIVPCLTLSSK